MVWGHKVPKPAEALAAVAGLDLNAARARAAFGGVGVPPRPALLADPHEELPLAISLQNRAPAVSPAALNLRRSAPHLLVAGFLPYLGQARQWAHGRHRLDANAALTLVAEQLRLALAGVAGTGVTIPTYLAPTQVRIVTSILTNAKLSPLGSCPLPLALACHLGQGWRGHGLVLDADDHAVTWSLVVADAKQVRLLATVPLPGTGVRAWIDQLMAFVADRCIRLCRRDPRDSAAAEQGLDDQLSAALERPRAAQPLQLCLRTEHWFQNLAVPAEDVERACAGLVRAVVDGMKQCLQRASGSVTPDRLWVTASAARLPGLPAAVGVRLPERLAIEELSVAAPAEAAHALALRRLQGELPPGHLDIAVPRPSDPLSKSERLIIR